MNHSNLDPSIVSSRSSQPSNTNGPNNSQNRHHGTLDLNPGIVSSRSSQHSNTNGSNNSQNRHNRTLDINSMFSTGGDIGRQIISMAGPTRPLKRSQVFDRLDGDMEDDGEMDRLKGEMREDTEEIDALLCSDDEFSDDEMASTGHSGPHNYTDEEDDSFIWPTVGHRSTVYYRGLPTQITFIEPAVSPVISSCWASVKLNIGPYNCTTQCKEHQPPRSEFFLDSPLAKRRRMGPTEPCKGSRREEVRCAVEALRRVVPGARGRDGIAVIDVAIEYLKSLKVEMKTMGLELDAL